MLDFAVSPSSTPLPEAQRAAVLAKPGFGVHFTDHMVSVTWSKVDGWHDAQVRAYGPLQLDPSAAVLHYAQEIFEGLKAYRHEDGSVWCFRPDKNAARFQRSARRLALPELPAEDFLAAVRALVTADEAWVPAADAGEASLYLRPFMFASEGFLGVRPAAEVTFCVIASPAGPYFSGGVRPVSIWLSNDYSRAAQGGTGAAKCGGNYAAGLAPQVEAIERGCDQVCFLDAVEHRWVEELGGMNLYFVLDDGTVVTPELGTILEGVTRDSIMTLLEDAGHKVVERRISIDEWREGAASGAITEVFACGTAAVVTPVGRLVSADGEVTTADGGTGPVTAAVRSELLDIQYGRTPDRYGWLQRLV